MKNIVESLVTKSGVVLGIENFPTEHRLEIALLKKTARRCLLHWGFQRAEQISWELPPQSAWPQSTAQADTNSVQTPFLKDNGLPRVKIPLPDTRPYLAIAFVLFFPDSKQWDNNAGRNYHIAIPQAGVAHAALEKAFKEAIARKKVLFERMYDVESDGRLAAAVLKTPEGFSAILLSEIPGPLVFHWGIARYSSYEWSFPPPSLQPPGTVTWQSTAQTLFSQRPDQLSELKLDIPESEAPAGIPFVLKQTAENRWLKDRGGNFFLPITTAAPRDTGVESGSLADMVRHIISAEMGKGSWTLMHRFNLCHDLLDAVRSNAEGLATLFVWLRFSAIRQLTWQRNYNTKPRELSHAQDRLTLKLSEIYNREPEARPWTRLMLTTVGRGGEGQRIRDEILQIMHRHHIKEVSGHFTEEWHQKLHNNTTPDDIAICLAYLEFLRSNGDLNRFYETLQRHGVTKARLESFERPIRTAPDFVPHLKDALIHDFENFLKILQSVHETTHFEIAIEQASWFFNDDTRNLLAELARNRNNEAVSPVRIAEQATEARRRISAELSRGNGVRELLYLDLALEQTIRTVIERNPRRQGDDLTDLVALAIENLLLSEDDPELRACYSHWSRLKGQPRFGRDWSLHAKSVLDRVGRVLSRWIDRTYQLLQPKAELLGNAFHADAWAITLFSEEVVRGSSLGFVLSLLIHHLDPILRSGAQLGKWQIVSRGSGTGTVELVPDLRSIQGKRFESPRVVVTEKVTGDEEIPEDVVAVVAPNVTDIVSHVAVRARNANLLFAACLDPDMLNHLKGLAGRQMALSINAVGDVVFEEAALGTAPGISRAQPARRFGIKPAFTTYAIPAQDFNPRFVGEKSCNQARLRGKLPGWINQPASVALPFGVFEHVLALKQNHKIADSYKTLASRLGSEPQKILRELRQIILELTAPDELITTLRRTMDSAGIAFPASTDDLWGCIKRVWASKWNDRAFFSRESAGIAHEELFMAVLVQKVVEAQYAFVIHTANPMTGNRDELYAEVVLGLGETVVANYPGRAFSFIHDRKTGAQNVFSYPSKSVGLYGGGLIFRSDSNGEDLAGYAGAGLYDSVLLPAPFEDLLNYTDERLIWDLPLRGQWLKEIAQLGIEVERVCGSPQDIEGVFANGEFFLVQTRPQVGLGHA